MGDRSWEYYKTCCCHSLSTVTAISITTCNKFSLTSPFTQHGPLKGVDDNTHHRQQNGRCYYCTATSILTFVGNVNYTSGPAAAATTPTTTTAPAPDSLIVLSAHLKRCKKN